MDHSGLIEHLIGSGLTPKTVELYLRQVAGAWAWCGEHGIELATASAVDLATWSKTVAPSTSSRRQARSALRYYYAWIGRAFPPLKAIRVPPKPRYLCRALSDAEAKAMVKTALGWYPQGLAVLAGLYMALRATEIAAMRWDRFDPQLSWYTVTGKGDRTDTIPVHPQFANELKRRKTAYVYIFPGGPGRAHVTPTTVWGWVKEVARVAGLPPIQTHQLRHTALATANDRLGDLRAVADFARHRRVETTMIYTRTLSRRLCEVVEALDYLGGGDNDHRAS